MNLAIGIDTGGTCTDAVLYDFDTRRVLGKNKALTTYDDLTRGILQALDGLDPTLCRKAKLAGLSTTLATNACVEGKFRRTRLLLLGIDRRGIEKHGAPYGFTDPDDIRYLSCHTTITGAIEQEPDWDLLRKNAADWFAGVEACAVCEIYGMRNGAVLEQKAARIIGEQTGLPTVCASLLFSGLSSLERAASAVLNAGLLPVTRDFLAAVQRAFHARGIHAAIHIVRSDSSLMGLDYSAEHAVETLLSGPAASALGGSALTGEPDAVIVDIGGTTTDVALVQNGMPLLSDDGIRVGQWKTLIRGLFSTSFALGGDSAIRWDIYGNRTIGPDRIIPLCVLASRYPAVTKILHRLIEDTPTHTLMLHEFLTLARADWADLPLELDADEKKLCRALEAGPLSLQQASDVLGIDKYQLHTRALEQAGIVLRAGLTPTDIMHVRGDYTHYDRNASLYAARFAAGSLHLGLEALCDEIYTEVSHRVFDAISQMLLEHASPYYRTHGLDDGMRELLRLQWENRASGGSGMLQYAFHTPAKIIGIGGPVHLFLPAAAQALGAEYVIPEGASTANAAGAVTGQTTYTATAEIRPHGLSPEDAEQGDFEVLCEGQPPRYFATEDAAAVWASKRLAEYATARVRAQGAAGELSVSTDSDDVTGGGCKLCTRIRVTASTCLGRTMKEVC